MSRVQVIANNEILLITSKNKIQKSKMAGRYDGDNRFILDTSSISPLEPVNYLLEDKCVACSSCENLTKHHVVPRRVVKLYPDILVSTLFTRNTVRLCLDCHRNFNEEMDRCGNNLTMSTKYWNDKFREFLKKNKKIKTKKSSFQKIASFEINSLKSKHHYKAAVPDIRNEINRLRRYVITLFLFQVIFLIYFFLVF